MIGWLRDSFAQAKANGSSEIMLISKADPGFAAVASVGEATREAMVDFKRPVAYVHGDSRYFASTSP